MRVIGALIAAAALAALLVSASPSPAASRRVATQHYQLKWHLPVKVNHKLAMRVQVRWVSIYHAGWRVNAVVVNRSEHLLELGKLNREGWGLGALPPDVHSGQNNCSAWSHNCFFARGIHFVPRLPKRLPPGARWSGIYSGRGAVPDDRYVSFTLGYYEGWPRDGFGIDTSTSRVLHIP
jgi:hypothetical protein